MSYRLQDHYSLRPDKQMTHYDNSTIYVADMLPTKDCVVLELKCNAGHVPTWMIDLITQFQLTQQGFSKYMNSTLTSHFDDGVNYMTGNRVANY